MFPCENSWLFRGVCCQQKLHGLACRLNQKFNLFQHLFASLWIKVHFKWFIWMFIWIISVTVHVVKEEFDPRGLFLQKKYYVSRPGGWKPFREAHRRTTVVSPDPRINRTNQRLFNENKASRHIIISWTEPRSLIIHRRHPCLNCTAATTHPSHTVSGTPNTAFGVIELQKWAGHPSLSSIHRRRATAIGFRSPGVIREMSVCHLKQSTWELARRSRLCETFSEAHCPRNCLITALLFMVLDCLL